MRSSFVCAILLATSSAHAGWTGVRIFIGDPKAAWDGTSDCAPCNRFCADLARYTRGTDWRVGFSEQRREGGDNHFALLRALPDEATPYFESVRDGKSVKILEGYRGDIQAIIDLYPGPTRRGSSNTAVSFAEGGRAASTFDMPSGVSRSSVVARQSPCRAGPAGAPSFLRVRAALLSASPALLGARLARFVVFVFPAFRGTLFACRSAAGRDGRLQRSLAGTDVGACCADVGAVLTQPDARLAAGIL